MIILKKKTPQRERFGFSYSLFLILNHYSQSIVIEKTHEELFNQLKSRTRAKIKDRRRLLRLSKLQQVEKNQLSKMTKISE